MATTRLMPLHTGKGRTVGQAISAIIDYTENPQKTDGGRLITSWQCDSRIADAEFLFAKNQYTQKTGRVRGEDDVIAYHLRQSFVPGEITPEEANRLGCELAKRFTKGNRKQRLSLCYMVMQDVNHQLFTESTEEEMLISMAEPATDKADAVLDRLDLLQFKERHPMALSGGQKQRVAIATALVSERKILVLDEPTSGLDLQHMKEVADELVTIQKIGKTSLVITHDYELIVSCCTHVLHLEHGVVQEQYALDATGLQLLKNFFIESR